MGHLSHPPGTPEEKIYKLMDAPPLPAIMGGSAPPFSSDIFKRQGGVQISLVHASINVTFTCFAIKAWLTHTLDIRFQRGHNMAFPKLCPARWFWKASKIIRNFPNVSACLRKFPYWTCCADGQPGMIISPRNPKFP
jgi:hypothetical protein